jgi:hypothetical protein
MGISLQRFTDGRIIVFGDVQTELGPGRVHFEIHGVQDKLLPGFFDFTPEQYQLFQEITMDYIKKLYGFTEDLLKDKVVKEEE